MLQISFIIVGGGIGGLSAAIALRRAGHRVLVLEATKELVEVGAGIQVPPNAARIIDAWGFLDTFMDKIVQPGALHIRKYSTGETLSETPLGSYTVETYGYPYWLIHRADYRKLLYDAAIELGAEIIFDAKVDSVDGNLTTVTLYDGTSLAADVIIGADGIRSKVRLAVMPDDEIYPTQTGICAHRATIPASLMRADPKTSFLVDDPNTNFWIGYNRHVVGYPIQNGNFYNIVFSHITPPNQGRWAESGNLNELRKQYRNFDSVIQCILEKIDTCIKWSLADLPTLSSWVSPNGRIAVMGDAAHAMVPFLAQGAATTIEDSAVLGELFSHISSINQIPSILALYEKIRRPRVEKIKKKAMELGDTWHMPDGDNQSVRDQVMKMYMSVPEDLLKIAVKNPNLWSDPEFQSWLFSYNAIAVAKKRVNECVETIRQESFKLERSRL